ncbi:uncharacterized protein LOC118438089 [Folsomia candida]|nr:uncharacterized protein LOC118438089 [Folsomia candida]
MLPVFSHTDEIILRKLDYLQASVNELRETFHLAVRQNTTIIEEAESDDLEIPLKNVADFEELEAKLMDPKIRSSLVKRLSVSGSKGTDAIYRVLALLMTNELATLISYAGTRGGKQSFRDHERITGCVYLAVRKNPLMSTATNKEIDGSIGEWLKKATTRIDNKKKKMMSKSTEQVTP